jgi:hypothetical protein
MAHEVLTAPHPFTTNEQIEGCPKCRQCGTIIPVCDEPGCWNHASCGVADARRVQEHLRQPHTED